MSHIECGIMDLPELITAHRSSVELNREKKK